MVLAYCTMFRRRKGLIIVVLFVGVSIFLNFAANYTFFDYIFSQDDTKPERFLRKKSKGAAGNGFDLERLEEWDHQFPLDAEPVHKIAGLSCESYGGPANGIASEMVYWEDIPTDSHFVSPLKDPSKEQYLTFEPDTAGWNNIRMGLETVIAMAHAMGRTLVLPPDRRIWAMNEKSGPLENHKDQKNVFSFDEFYHLESLSTEHVGLKIITMEEFLQRVAIKQKAFVKKDSATGVKTVFYPPNNRTQWDGAKLDPLYDFLRDPSVSYIEKWEPGKCLASFPASRDESDIRFLNDTLQQIISSEDQSNTDKRRFVNKPTPVNGSTLERMTELIDRRQALCLYDKKMQDAFVVHFKRASREGYRLLTHFYGFLFFQDWTHDLWTKRFVRDHLRYNDEIMCAAARVVHALRKLSIENSRKSFGSIKVNNQLAPANTKLKEEGIFHTMHVRRNDFGRQYKNQVVDAEILLKNSKDELYQGATLFIATDEKDSSYFDPLREHYHVYLLSDFHHLLTDVNSNVYSLIDQLVAARGETFHGVFLSTFTGFINRLRGYYSVKEMREGYELGLIKSYHVTSEKEKFVYHEYHPFRNPSFYREFPAAWRDIDRGIEELVKAHNTEGASYAAR